MVHTVHTNRQTGQEGRERRVWETEGGEREDRTLGCALFSLNEGKQFSHTFSPTSEIKKTNKIIQIPPTPHINKRKNNNTVAVENREKNKKKEHGCSKIAGERTTLRVLHKQETEARGGSRCVGGQITLMFLICVWLGASKGLARESRGKRRYTERQQRRKWEEGAGWSFSQSIDTPFVSLVHSNLHTQYAAAVW